MAMILSIETSTSVCSVALIRGADVLAKEILFTEQSHSTHLTLLITEVLKKGGAEMQDLEAVAVSEGPGSYTGLRIGVSTAKGLCYTLKIPLISVPTLKAMAYEVSLEQKDGLLVPMLDARRMEVYTSTFDRDLYVVDELRPLILDESSFGETLAKQKMFFFGNGAGKFMSIIDHPNAEFIENKVPQAWCVGLLAAQKFLRQEFVDTAYFEPNYLKAYQATKPKKLL